MSVDVSVVADIVTAIWRTEPRLISRAADDRGNKYAQAHVTLA